MSVSAEGESEQATGTIRVPRQLHLKVNAPPSHSEGLDVRNSASCCFVKDSPDGRQVGCPSPALLLLLLHRARLTQGWPCAESGARISKWLGGQAGPEGTWV